MECDLREHWFKSAAISESGVVEADVSRMACLRAEIW